MLYLQVYLKLLWNTGRERPFSQDFATRDKEFIQTGIATIHDKNIGNGVHATVRIFAPMFTHPSLKGESHSQTRSRRSAADL